MPGKEQAVFDNPWLANHSRHKLLTVPENLMSRVRDVLGFRKLVMMMRLCVRNSRRSHCSNDQNCKEFLQKIVHEANLISESLTRG